MGLHPAVAAVRRTVRRALVDLGPGDTVVVACSGGADSLALLAATVHEAREPGWQVVGATVDHGLQAGSQAHAQHVLEQMRDLGVDETVGVRVQVEARGMGPEAAAREARYAVLTEVAQRYDARTVLLGHTMDDQAETVLMGLARGSGGRALSGMRRAFGVYRRPLLDVSRSETETACVAEGLQYWTDPHNQDEGYTRVRVRTRVLPLLEQELGPGVTAALARTADLLRADTAYLDAVASVALGDARATEGLAVEVLAALDPAIRTRVLRQAAADAGAPSAELFHGHVTELDRLVTDWHGQKWVDLPGHVRALRSEGEIVFLAAG